MSPMQNTEYFLTMARYNQWMSEKLYAVCAEMTDDIRKRESGAPFNSIHGLLNHMLLADRVWLGRFQNRPFIVSSLSQELYGDFDELKTERAKTNEEIIRWTGTLTSEVLAGSFTFTSIVNPNARTMPLWTCVLHFFNHQTHHRGQAHACLSILTGGEPPSLDLLAFQRGGTAPDLQKIASKLRQFRSG